MFTSYGTGATRTLRAISAVMVVALSATLLEYGHVGMLPEGVVEVGELVPVSVGGQPVATTADGSRG
jgi:hypothetical protein